MVSQHLTIDVLNHAGGDLYARTGEGESRAVLFGITSGGENGFETLYINIDNPVVTARIVKPDGTFTITTAELISSPGEIQQFRFFIPEAATQVSGIGSYDIRIQEDGEENIVYSAQGRFICDDNMLTDEMIESVAEVNGLIFPDDFLTTESGAATIDDEVTALDSTWSSDKIADEISGATAGLIDDNSTSTGTTWSSDKIADEIADGAAAIIDDTEETTGTTWSSDKIADEIADGAAAIIDDTDQTTTTTWSSDKIADEIASASPTVSDDYTLTEQQVGTWLGTPLYRRVIEVTGVKQPGSYYTLLNDNTINLIKYEGTVQNGYWTGAGCMLNSYYNSSNYCGCAYSSNDGARIDWYNNLGTAVSKIYLIIYYTKK